LQRIVTIGDLGRLVSLNGWDARKTLLYACVAEGTKALDGEKQSSGLTTN